RLPPRRSAPGPLAVVLAPDRHMASPLKPPQPGQAVDAGTQSATHSWRLPFMSNAPAPATRLTREPVVATANVLPMLQSVVPLSVPGSGVPRAAACHSWFVARC